MFFNAPGNPTNFKKAIYLFAATILGVLLSFIAHAVIEINYLNSVLSQGRTVRFYGNCALPPALSILLLILGAVGGFLLGRVWWRLVYIDRVWAKKYSSKK
ncbi:MAG: hypothetical protein WCV70_02230 [Patescibacteria group bacterium]|jgi:hypothetical protein